MTAREMAREFRAFLKGTATLSLAIAVIIGAAVSKVITAVVDDVVMPAVGLMLPDGDWRHARIVLSRAVDAAGNTTENALRYGHLLGSVVDLVIIAFIVFLITRWLIKPDGAPAKKCPECLETIPAVARRCRACTSPVS